MCSIDGACVRFGFFRLEWNWLQLNAREVRFLLYSSAFLSSVCADARFVPLLRLQSAAGSTTGTNVGSIHPHYVRRGSAPDGCVVIFQVNSLMHLASLEPRRNIECKAFGGAFFFTYYTYHIVSAPRTFDLPRVSDFKNLPGVSNRNLHLFIREYCCHSCICPVRCPSEGISVLVTFNVSCGFRSLNRLIFFHSCKQGWNEYQCRSKILK